MLKNIRQSLITRLMLYFFIVGFALVALFSLNIAFGIKVHFKNEILPNISQYLIYIAQDIGAPPNITKAKALGEKLTLKIKILGPDIDWQSSQTKFEIEKLNFEVAPYPYQEFKIAHRHGNNYILLNKEGYNYYFSMGKAFQSPSSIRNFTLMVVLIVFIFYLFFLIRKSLKPLQTISTGVKKIAQGELDSPIVIQKSYEFEQLANGINTMAAEIKTMLDAKQQLLLAISHELRSPITRAQVNLALLPENEIQQALKHDMQEMENLIAQILESQRLNQIHSPLNKTAFSLDELIHSVISHYFEQGAVVLELEPTSINADKTRILLLVKNLIDNALKYSTNAQTKPIVRLFHQQAYAVLEIEDFGIGIEKEELKHITQAFYRIDKARQRATGGFGLGLYLAGLIVKAHDAQISFSSKLGVGTKVTVKFSSVE